LAHGQFMDYRYALEEEEPDRKLYLAVPVNVYRTFFSLKFIQKVVQRSQIDLLIYDPDRKVIVQWQP
jgi:XisH protein